MPVRSYYVRAGRSARVEGPMTTADARRRMADGTLPADAEMHAAEGQTDGRLKRSTECARIASAEPEHETSGAVSPTRYAAQCCAALWSHRRTRAEVRPRV